MLLNGLCHRAGARENSAKCPVFLRPIQLGPSLPAGCRLVRAGKATRADTETSSSKRPTTAGCNAGRQTGASGVDQSRCCQPYRVRRQQSELLCDRTASPGRRISLASQPTASRTTTSQPIQRMVCLQSLPVGDDARGSANVDCDPTGWRSATCGPAYDGMRPRQRRSGFEDRSYGRRAFRGAKTKTWPFCSGRPARRLTLHHNVVIRRHLGSPGRSTPGFRLPEA